MKAGTTPEGFTPHPAGWPAHRPREADLESADLKRADLSNTNALRANLNGAVPTGANVNGVTTGRSTYERFESIFDDATVPSKMIIEQ